MITNEERREVAARLRVLASHREVDKDLFHDAIGVRSGGCLDGYDPVNVMELADLIGPEPSPTCRDDGPSVPMREMRSVRQTRIGHGLLRLDPDSLLPELQREGGGRMSGDKYCPFAGYNPPCGCCMMALRKNGMLFCGFAWDSATQTHGRGNENKIT